MYNGLFLSLSAVLLCLTATPPLPAEEQQNKAISALKMADAKVVLDGDGNAVSVTFPFSIEVVPSVTNDDLAHLRSLPRLKSLSMSQCVNVTNNGMKHLTGLKTLESLELSMPEVTEEGLKHCTGLTSLKVLSIGNLKGAEVSGRALSYFPGSKNLRMLKIEPAFGVTDEGLQHLCLFPKLRSINLAAR